jgi:hypothetical protein
VMLSPPNAVSRTLLKSRWWGPECSIREDRAF